jgi:hypothetical protein
MLVLSSTSYTELLRQCGQSSFFVSSEVDEHVESPLGVFFGDRVGDVFGRPLDVDRLHTAEQTNVIRAGRDGEHTGFTHCDLAASRS